MATYRDLLQHVKARDRRGRRARAVDPEATPFSSTCASSDEWDEGHIPGAIHIPRGNLESRIEGLVPDRNAPIVVYCASGTARRSAPTAWRELGYEHVSSLAGGFTDWKRNGYDDRAAADALARAARALLAPPADPRDRRGGTAEAARLAHPADRRRRPRLARRALPRRRRRRPDRDHRRRHRRRVEPAAPDRPLARHARHAEGRQRQARDRGAQPRRRGDDLPRAADLGEHRPDPRRRLGHHRRRRRQLPDALPRQRRLGLARASPSCTARSTASRARSRSSSRATAPATAASTPRRRRRSSRRRAPRAACSACCRASSARCRRTRR